MRILHVISSLDTTAGGTTSFVRGLAAAQAATGMKVRVISTWAGATEPREVADALQSAGVEVRQVGPTKGRLWRHPAITATVSSALHEVDVVHIHALWEEIQHRAARLAQANETPYIISPHGMLDPWSLRQNRLAKRILLAWRVRRNLKRAAALHFTCDIERDLAAALNLEQTAIIEPPGLDFTEFDPPPRSGAFRDEWRAKYPDIDRRPVVLFLSRLHPKKGFDLLLPAFAQMNNPDALLVIAGPDSDSYGDTLRRMANQLGIEDRTLFTGMLRGRARIAAFADADLFVLPSHQENFGIAVTESLAAGTPVIISDQVNIHPEITRAQVGAVVATNIDALAAELTRWLADRSLRAAAAQRAGPFARERYDWHQIAARWRDHYVRLVRADPPQSAAE